MSDDNDGGEGLDSRLSDFRVEADGTYYIAVGNSKALSEEPTACP